MNKWSRFKFTPNLPLGANGERVTGSKAHMSFQRKLPRKAWYFSKTKTTYSLLQRVLR